MTSGGGPEPILTARLLRALPVGSLIAAGVRWVTPQADLVRAARELFDGLEPPLPADNELRVALRSLDLHITKEPRRPGRPALHGDAHYREIGALYVAAWNAGDRRPTKAVADAKVVAHSTAAKWVGEARRRGFLGPTTPRRPGVIPHRP